MNILICYISPTTLTENKPFYANDFAEPFMGMQTNEAPAFYAVELLKKQNETIDRVIALRTSASSCDTFENSVRNYLLTDGITSLPDGFFQYIDTEVDKPITVVLADVIGRISQNDSIIIDTSGGPRAAMTMLSLLSRFLQFIGCKVLFSIVAEYNRDKEIGVLSLTQDNEIMNLLEATRIFTGTGNTDALRDACGKLNIPEKRAFFKATREFYLSVNICNTGVIEEKSKALSIAIRNIKKTRYKMSNPNEVIFRYVLLEAVENKMSFIYADYPILEVAQWCNDNWYLQQAVTILWENIVSKRKCFNGKQVKLELFDHHTLGCLRHNINHATGYAKFRSKRLKDDDLWEKVREKVDNLFKTPYQIRSFNDSILTKIRKMCNIADYRERATP